jgi:signal transduction histidine kinase
MKSLPVRLGWLTGLSIAAVLAVNLAGIWAITVARRGAAEEAERAFAAEVTARGRGIETRLASIRGDLAFLAAATPVAQLEGDRGRWAAERRAGTESALLYFLRSHAEARRVVLRSRTGEALVHTGRRGGVPLMWVSSEPTGQEGVAMAATRPRLTSVLRFEPDGGGLEVEADPTALLLRGDGAAAACALRDRAGSLLASSPRGAATALGGGLLTEAAVQADGWSAPGPWVLACARPATAAGLVEPVSTRHRQTLVLNLAVMALAVLLGGFTLQEARRRARLEAQAREEARVRELERQLFHAERLTTVGRLAAGIAHEINNPLEGMSNYLALARDAASRGDQTAVARHLEAIRQGLERAAGVVRQVLAHADSARAPETPVDLNQVLRETGDFVRSRREFSGIRFALDLVPGPLLVRGSAVMLGQVAVNLILNACEAQPSGGEVAVRSRRDGNAVLAEFTDRGPGIPEADRERIFEPFFSTKDSTGLGLSICHTIVRQHGGELSVVARGGGGACFRIRLPTLET